MSITSVRSLMGDEEDSQGIALELMAEKVLCKLQCSDTRQVHSSIPQTPLSACFCRARARVLGRRTACGVNPVERGAR